MLSTRAIWAIGSQLSTTFLATCSLNSPTTFKSATLLGFRRLTSSACYYASRHRVNDENVQAQLLSPSGIGVKSPDQDQSR